MIFISYRREDSLAVARDLAGRLRAKFDPESIFFDEASIALGTNWIRAIRKAASSASVMLAPVGRDWVRAADEFARRRIDDPNDVLVQELCEAHDSHIPIVPLWIDGQPPLPAEALPKHLKFLADQQGIAFDITRDFDRLCEKLKGLGIEAGPAPTAAIDGGRHFSVPHLPNPDLVGRGEIIASIRQDLVRAEDRISRNKVIHGLGGTGKTQVAVCYAHLHRNDYRNVWWLEAEESISLASGYADIAKQLKLPGLNPSDQRETIQAVREWLDTADGWLLVLDNAISPQRVRDYLPRGLTGHVLITSQNPHWDRYAKSVYLDVLAENDAVAYLTDQTGDADAAAARELAHELGRLPLAIAHAAAYIKRTGGSLRLRDYIDRFRKHGLRVQESPGVLSDTERTVCKTFQLAFNEISDQSPASVDLLRLCAHLAPVDMPMSLLRSYRWVASGDVLAAACGDDLLWDECISRIYSFSLIGIRNEEITVHRLVQQAVLFTLDGEARDAWAAKTLELLHRWLTKPAEDVRIGALSPALLAHLIHVVPQACPRNVALPICAELLVFVATHQIGLALFEDAAKTLADATALEVGAPPEVSVLIRVAQAELAVARGDYAAARSRFAEIRERLEQHPEMGDRARAAYLGAFGVFSKDTEDYKEAAAALGDAHRIWSTVRSGDAPEALDNLWALAELYYKLGKHDAAASLLNRVLEGRRRHVAGADHIDLAAVHDDLGLVLYAQGDVRRSIEQHEKGLAIRKKHLSERHPLIGESQNNLAMAVLRVGEVERAEELYVKARETFESINPHHPALGAILGNLLAFYRRKNQLERAEEVSDARVNVLRRQFDLGEKIDFLAKSILAHAGLLHECGKYDRASSVLEELGLLLDEASETQLGFRLQALLSLASVRSARGEFDESHRLADEAVRLSAERFGSSSITHVNVRLRQASLLEQQQRYKDAAALLGEVLSGYRLDDADSLHVTLPLVDRKVRLLCSMNELEEAARSFHEFAAFHPNQPVVTSAWIRFLTDLARVEEADEAYRSLLERDPDNAFLAGNYAVFLKNLKQDYAACRRWYEKSLEGQADSIRLSNYALFLSSVEGDHARAEDLYLQSIEIDPTKADAIGNLAFLYHHALGDIARASRYYQLALAVDPFARVVLANHSALQITTEDAVGARTTLGKLWSCSGRIADRATARGLAMEATLLCLAGEDPAPAIGYLKALAARRYEAGEWAVHALLKHVRSKLDSRTAALLAAIYALVSKPADLREVQQHDEWRLTPTAELGAKWEVVFHR
jgi:tetratricopeptide (TPR) repeat protein